MRTAPALQIRVTRCGAWNMVVSGLALVAIGVIAGWLATRTQARQTFHLFAAACAWVVLGLLALRSCRRMPATLRWDGAIWTLEAGGGVQPALPAPRVEGRLQVALDLGPWLLLTFDPVAASGRFARRWLPVQRRGLEAEWHALRCAVHAPVASGVHMADPNGR